MKPALKHALWVSLIGNSVIVYFFGILFAPEFEVGGHPFFVWVIWASWAMLASGSVLGILQVVSRYRQLAKEAARLDGGDEPRDDSSSKADADEPPRLARQAANDSSDDPEPIRSVIV